MTRQRTTHLILAATLLTIGLFGCNKRSENTASDNAPQGAMRQTVMADSTSTSSTTTSSTSAPSATSSAPGTVATSDGSVMQNGIDTSDLAILKRPKVVIKNGELSLHAENYEASMDRIRQMTHRFGGYIAHERVHTVYTNAIQADLTIKVPYVYFDTVLNFVKKMGDKVVDEDISAEEMTEQYEQSRTNLADTKAQVARLKQLLASTNLTVKQRLDIERQLADIQSDVASSQSSHNSLVRRVSYSTLTINLNADQKPGPFMRIWIAVSEGLDTFVDVLARLLGIMIAALPVLALIGLIVWLAIRYNRHQQNKLKLEAEEESKS